MGRAEGDGHGRKWNRGKSAGEEERKRAVAIIPEHFNNFGCTRVTVHACSTTAESRTWGNHSAGGNLGDEIKNGVDEMGYAGGRVRSDDARN